MKIRTIIDPVPSEDLYGIKFRFEDFTEEEKFLINKYGFISVDLPSVSIEHSGNRSGFSGKLRLDSFVEYKFLFPDKKLLEGFISQVVDQIQRKLKENLTFLSETAGEQVYEVTAGGEIKKINDGARKAIDKNSKEYKEIIEKNREAFEKLSKL